MNTSTRTDLLRVLAALARALVVLCLLVAAGFAQPPAARPGGPAKLRTGVLVFSLRAEGEDARAGLAIHNLLENLLALHGGLEQRQGKRHSAYFFNYESSAQQWRQGQLTSPASLAEKNLRYFLTGSVRRLGEGFEASLEIEDRESGRKVSKLLPLDTPTLVSFREGFIAMLEEVGLVVPPGQRAKMLLKEELPASALGLLGQGLASSGDSAPGLFEQALKVAPRSYLLLNNYGWALLERERVKEAEAAFELALAVNPAGADAAEGIKRLASQDGNPVKSVVFKALVAEALNPEVTPESLAEIMRAYGLLKSDISEVRRKGLAREEARGFGVAKAIPPAVAQPTAGERLGLNGGTFSNWGGVASSVTDFETATLFYERVLKVVGGDIDNAEEAAVLNKLGIALTSLGRQEEAIEKFNRAKRLAKSTSGADYALTVNNLGLAYASFGRYKDAVSAFEEAESIALTYRDEASRAVILNNLGLVTAATAEYEQAVGYYQQALDIQLGPRGDKDDAAVTLNNLGVVYAAMERVDDSLKQYEKSLALARGARDAVGEAVALNNVANAQRQRGRYEDAAAQYAQALEAARRANLRTIEGAALNGLGVVRYQQARYEEAAKLFAQSLPLRRAFSNRLGEGITLHNLMLAWKARGNAPVATFFGKQAVNVYQDLRADIERMGRAPHESFLASKVETYRQLAGLLIAQGRLPEAEVVMAMLKEEEHYESERDAGAPPTALRVKLAEDPQLEAQYAQVADDVVALGKQRAGLVARKGASDARAAVELDRELAEIDAKLAVSIDHFNAFLNSLDKKNVSPSRVEAARDMLGMRETLGMLGPGTVALYTIVDEDAYRAMLIAPGFESAYETPVKREALRAKVEDFRLALRNRRVDPSPLARELYKTLVGPDLERDLKRLGAKTLMWSLDDVLRYVPVAALQDADGKYLVEQYRTALFTPSRATNLRDNVEPRWKGLGAGVSKAKPGGFGELPGVPRELHAIFGESAPAAAACNGAAAGGVLAEGKVLLDECFTKESLLAALRPAPRLVHIASHFKFQPGGKPDDSFLLLGAGDAAAGRLTLREINRIDFQGVNLLTLSACETAVGDLRANGVEVENFGIDAQRRGAQAVLASLWRVADASTPQLMRDFYREREAGQGMSKAEALQRAQLGLLRGTADAPADAAAGDPKPETPAAMGLGGDTLPPFQRDVRRPYAHPYYWAPFILMGNWK